MGGWGFTMFSNRPRTNTITIVLNARIMSNKENWNE